MIPVSSRWSARISRPILAAIIAQFLAPSARAEQFNQVAGELITLNANGAWSWYMDERVIVDAAGKLLASSVANPAGTSGPARSGDIDVVSYNLAANQLDSGAAPFVLHDNLAADDHNGAALLVRPDGRYLAVYTKHNA